jgi:hypothetical protein
MWERVMANYPEVPQWLIKQGVKCPDDISHVITDRSARLALIKEQHIKAMGDLKEINKIALAYVFTHLGVQEKTLRRSE